MNFKKTEQKQKKEQKTEQKYEKERYINTFLAYPNKYYVG